MGARPIMNLNTFLNTEMVPALSGPSRPGSYHRQQDRTGLFASARHTLQQVVPTGFPYRKQRLLTEPRASCIQTLGSGPLPQWGRKLCNAKTLPGHQTPFSCIEYQEGRDHRFPPPTWPGHGWCEPGLVILLMRGGVNPPLHPN